MFNSLIQYSQTYLWIRTLLVAGLHTSHFAMYFQCKSVFIILRKRYVEKMGFPGELIEECVLHEECAQNENNRMQQHNMEWNSMDL